MSHLIKSELFKLKRDRSFWTIVWILIAVSFLYPLLTIWNEDTELRKVSDFYRLAVLNGNNYVIRLIPCILAGFFISSEYSNGTLKSMVASGSSRIRLYFSKLIVYAIGTIVISLIFPLVLTGAASLYLGFYEMPDPSYFGQTIGLTILYSAAFSSMMALFAFGFTDSGKSISFLLVTFFLCDMILYGLSELIPLVKPVLNYSVFKLLMDVASVDMLRGSEVLVLTVVPIVTFVVFGLLGSMLFSKKEIK